MSGSFRYVGGAFMHHALTVAQEEPGERLASRLLADLYTALQPVERACAWVEDGDSMPGEELEALKMAMPQILQSVEALERLAGVDRAAPES